MQKVIQFGFATLVWGVILMFSPDFVVKLWGLALIPTVCAMFALFGTIFPRLFEMGVQGFRKANIVEKVIPLLIVLALCYGATLMPQTYATAILVSILIGNSTSYIGYIVGGLVR